MAESNECPNIVRCELFPKIRTDSALAFCQDSYCRGEFTRCARYQYGKEHGKKPPIELLPNGKSLG